MKTIGLIGGMSWESSDLYYQILNRTTQKELGGVHSSDCLLYSVDFGEIAELQHKNDWVSLSEKMINAAKRLEAGGSDFVLLCTNTMHKLADDIQSNINIPLLHIVDSTAEKISSKSINKVGFLGTKFSMEGEFLRNRYLSKFNIETIVPDQKDRNIIHEIIYDELVKGIIKEESKKLYLGIIEKLIAKGAKGIISGCTEIELLIKPQDLKVPLFETTKIHAEKAVELALKKTT
jgi:aspartate racemase